MSAKTSAVRRAAFFAALRATGNRTLAAERARVSQSWVTLHRANDPAFKAECDAAVAEAKARLGGAAGMRPGRGLRAQDGEELVVRGKNGRRVQIARARIKQWTPRAEARFLTTLAASCNVKAACAEVGLSVPSAYNHYHRWPEFARRWNEALALGYVRIESALVENACNLFSPSELAPDAEMPPMRVDQAIHLLHMHKYRLHGIGGRPGSLGKPPDMEKVRASILRKIDMIERVDAWREREREAKARK